MYPGPAALIHSVPYYLRWHLIKKCLCCRVSVLSMALLGSNKGPELSLVLWEYGRHQPMKVGFCITYSSQTKAGLGQRDLS